MCLCNSEGFPASPLEFSEIGYLLLPSRDMAEIPLNRRKSSKNQTKPTVKATIKHKPRDFRCQQWQSLFYSR